MNQSELLANVASVSGQNRKVTEAVLKAAGDVITAALKEGAEVPLPGLGKLTVEVRAARKGRNPQTGAEIDIPAKRVATFHAAKALKDALVTH